MAGPLSSWKDLLQQAESTFLNPEPSSSGSSKKSLRHDFRISPYPHVAIQKSLEVTTPNAEDDELALNTLKDAFKKKSIVTIQCFLGLRIDQFSRCLEVQNVDEFLYTFFPNFKTELKLLRDERSNINGDKLLVAYLIEMLGVLEALKHGQATDMERIYCEILMDSILELGADARPQRGYWTTLADDELSELFIEFTVVTKQLARLRSLLRGHEQLLMQIKNISLAHVQRLALDGRVQEAVAVLEAMECQVLEEIHAMVLDTTNPALRDSFYNMLVEQNRLSPTEMKSLEFFTYFMKADPAQLTDTLRMWAPHLENNLTLRSFLKLSDEKQQWILVHTTSWSYGSQLMELCSPEIVWEYLIETRKVEEILKWSQIWVSRSNESVFPYTMPVTQGMIDNLPDNALNQLATYGLFTTSDRTSLPKFLRRTLVSDSIEANLSGRLNMDTGQLSSLIISHFIDRGTLACLLYFLEGWPHLLQEMQNFECDRPEAIIFWKLVSFWKSKQKRKDLLTCPDFLFLSILLCCFRMKKCDAFVYLGALISTGMFQSCTDTLGLIETQVFEGNVRVNLVNGLVYIKCGETDHSFDIAQTQLPVFGGGLVAAKPTETRSNRHIALNNENNISLLQWALYYLEMERPAFASIVIPEIPASAFFRHLFNTVLDTSSVNLESAATLFFLREESKYASLMSVFSKTSKLTCESSPASAVIRLMDGNNMANVFLLCNALSSLWAETVPKQVLFNLAQKDKFLSFLIVSEIYDILPCKVMEATKEFSTRTLRSHLLDCLFSPTTAQLRAIEKMETPLEELLEGPLFFPEDITEASVLPWQYLEYEGLRINSPTFILLAASKKNDLNRKDWLCKYLSTVTHTPSKDLDLQLIKAVECWEIRLLRDGWCIFMTEKRIACFLTWIVGLLNGEDDSSILNEFKKSLLTARKESEDTALIWEQSTMETLLIHLLRQEKLQGCTRRYLLKVFCEGDLRIYLKQGTFSDLKALLAIESVIQFEPITYSVSAILSGLGSCEFKAECEKIFHLLVHNEKFDRIQRLAQFLGMSVDTIVLQQFSSLYRTVSNESRLLFWCWCSECFEEAQVNPTTAVLFFLDHASQTLPGQETLWVLDTAFFWLDKVASKGDNQLNDITYQALEKKLWLSRLDALQHGSMFEEFRENNGIQWRKVVPRSELEEQAGIPKLKKRKGYLSKFQILNLEYLLNLMLRTGHVARALRLATLFQYSHIDIENLLLAIDIAEGTRLVKDVDLLPPECRDVMSALQFLTAKTGTIKSILSQITACFHLASLMDLNYKYVVSHPQPQQMFNIVLKNNKALTKPLLNALGLTPEAVSLEVSKEIMHRLKYDEKDFMKLLDICVDPCLLGNHLLQESRNLSKSDSAATIVQAVKAMILAHGCFMKWSNIQGVSGVLCIAPYVCQLLEHHKLWNIMVDLLIGIGHYDDMKYVFTMLKRNDVMEILLRKNTEQEARLRTALVDFVRRGTDLEMLKLVALYFCMHAELAEYWKEQAQLHSQEIVSSAAFCGESSLRFVDGNSSSVVESIVSAMRCWSHCAEYYMQAGKFEHADKASRKAQLCALQRSLCDITFYDKNILVLHLNEDEFHEISKKVSFEEAKILSSAYSFKMNWASALCYHLMEEESMNYLESFICNRGINGELVQMLFKELTTKYRLTSKVINHIESLLSLIPSLSVRYRLASQLGIHSYSEILLDSPPDEAYLKDTCYKVKDSTLY